MQVPQYTPQSPPYHPCNRLATTTTHVAAPLIVVRLFTVVFLGKKNADSRFYCDFHSSWDKKAKRAFRKCVLRLKKWGKSTRKRLGKSPISAFANAKRVCKRRKLTLNGPETQRKGFQTRHGPRMPRTVNADSKSTRATSYPERCPGAPPIVAWRRHIVRLAWLTPNINETRCWRPLEAARYCQLWGEGGVGGRGRG